VSPAAKIKTIFHYRQGRNPEFQSKIRPIRRKQNRLLRYANRKTLRIAG